jgi:hypothetical protein
MDILYPIKILKSAKNAFPEGNVVRSCLHKNIILRYDDMGFGTCPPTRSQHLSQQYETLASSRPEILYVYRGTVVISDLKRYRNIPPQNYTHYPHTVHNPTPFPCFQ